MDPVQALTLLARIAWMARLTGPERTEVEKAIEVLRPLVDPQDTKEDTGKPVGE